MIHTSGCSCLTCDIDGRQAFLASARGNYDTYERYLARYHSKRRGLRAASNDDLELRTGIHHVKDTSMDDYTPPNPYDPGIEKLRRELPRMNARVVPERQGDFTPPEPYAEPLARLRREQR